jgi:mRNA interferase MazF
MVEAAYRPNAGDIVWTDFDARLGVDERGGRPALVVSPAAFFRASGFAIVCPIVRKGRHFGANVAIPPGLPVAGEILTAHVRSIDARAHAIRYAGVVPATVLAEARAKLAALCGISAGG